LVSPFRCCGIEENSEPMSTNSPDDRWLLPRRQTEYPARDVLPEATVHGRREATFLALAALFLVTTATLIVLGTSRVIDANALVAGVLRAFDGSNADASTSGVLPVALLAPLGALPFAVSFVASSIACELFGRRRVGALVWTGLFASLALTAMMRGADVLDGGEAFGASLALTACYLLAHVTNLGAFDALRRRARGRGLFVRMIVATLVAEVIGWSAFAIALQVGGGTIIEPLERETILALALGGAAGSALCALVLAIPGALVARGLAVALRVGRDPYADEYDDDDSDGVPRGPRWIPASFAEGSVKLADSKPTRPTTEGKRPATRPGTEGKRPEAQAKLAEGSVSRRLPPAVIVDDEEDDSIKPFTSAEMRFFTEGDLATE
jgi:uncharacterized PurR-regulated membrane protein YhhQ (DUF165 family)